MNATPFLGFDTAFAAALGRSLVVGVFVAGSFAAESSGEPALRLAVDEQGNCTGLRVGAGVVRWLPSLPTGARMNGDVSTARDEQTERIDRFTPEARGLRWTQSVRNLTRGSIAVGPLFVASGGDGNVWTTPGLPLEVRFFSEAGIGISLIQHPEEAVWINSRRLDAGQTLTFTALIRAHAADWRPGMAALVEAYPEYLNPPNPRVHLVAGGGAYSASEAVPDVGKSLRMGFGVNWKASFDFSGIGVFVAPSPARVDATWRSIRGRETSIARMSAYATAMKEAGFHVLNYFNITEAGHNILQPAPKRITARDEDLWRHPNDWVHYGVRDAVLEDRPGHMLHTDWEGCVVVDPAEPRYRAHLVDQATRLARDIPDADGVCVDRMDHLGKVNFRRYDGASLTGGKCSGARLLVSWMQVMDELGPIFHRADKVMLGNPIRHYSLAAFRHLDGIYTEYWDEMKACSMLCVNKPLIVWSGRYDDAGLQDLLHHGAWPTCPMPGNDHSQGPDPKLEARLTDYGRMFDALRGRRWALHARPVICEDAPAARLNLFAIPGGYLATVTGAGSASRASLRLPGLPLPASVHHLQAWSITPGQEWTSVPLRREGLDWVMTIPVARGCGLARLHWAWVEPFQRWLTPRTSIRFQTTVPGAVIRATTDGAVVTDASPAWTTPEFPEKPLTLRAAIWKDGRRVGEELITQFVPVR